MTKHIFYTSFSISPQMLAITPNSSLFNYSLKSTNSQQSDSNSLKGKRKNHVNLSIKFRIYRLVQTKCSTSQD